MIKNIKYINESQIVDRWSGMLSESTGITDSYKLSWMSRYANNHETFDNSELITESFSGTGIAQLTNIPGQGAITFPGASTSTGGFHTASQGSGDKWPSLLPLAIQVAAKTIGFDIVNVIPMPGPTGILPYLDNVYAGGKLTTEQKPVLIEVPASGTFVQGTTYWGINEIGSGFQSGFSNPTKAIELVFVGNSRITGNPIFKIGATKLYTGSWAADTTISVADVFDGTAGISANSAGSPSTTVVSASVTESAKLVSALQDHIQGFTGAGANDTGTWSGNYVNGTVAYDPMSRETGESTYPRAMGIQTFTKQVQAGTFQAHISVTTEQIQDLNRTFGIDLLAMAESLLVNEVSQSINKHILSRAFALGWQNNKDMYEAEATTLNFTIDPSLTGNVSPAFIGKESTGITMPIADWVDYGSGNFENLYTVQRRVSSKILAAKNIVNMRGRRGPANFVVTNLQIASALQDNAQFQQAAFANNINQESETLYPIGTIFGMTIYVDPNMDWSDTRVLVGRKGADMEPGLKFMPYILAEQISTISEGTMSPKIAVKSRYALVDAGFHPQTQYYTFYVHGTATTPLV